MKRADGDTLRTVLDDYAEASHEGLDLFRSPEDRLEALHRRHRLEAELAERFPPPN